LEIQDLSKSKDVGPLVFQRDSSSSQAVRINRSIVGEDEIFKGGKTLRIHSGRFNKKSRANEKTDPKGNDCISDGSSAGCGETREKRHCKRKRKANFRIGITSDVTHLAIQPTPE